MTDKNKILLETEKVFFGAMMVGYANDGAMKTKTADGYKIIDFTNGSFKVVDRYCVTPYSTKSAGTTTIFFEDVPVWWMSYGGYYSDNVIPFLKVAIGQSYKNNIFNGGRGPQEYSEGNLFYKNTVEEKDFSKFKGREEIRNKETNELLGFHEYWGMGLL